MVTRSMATYWTENGMDDFPQTTDDLSQNMVLDMMNIICMLIGYSGDGLSRIGNLILGENVFEKFKSTKTVSKISKIISLSATQKCHLTIIDTPAIGNAEMRDEDVVREIGNGIDSTPTGLHCFLYVLPLHALTRARKEALKLYTRLFGDELVKRTIIIFAVSNDYPMNGRSPEEILATVGDTFRDFMNKCRMKYVICRSREIPLHEILDHAKKIKEEFGELNRDPLRPNFEEEILRCTKIDTLQRLEGRLTRVERQVDKILHQPETGQN